MYKLCVFAGTTEGRELVEFLSQQPVLVTACVATEYGQELIRSAENLAISQGRLTQQDMEALFAAQQFELVVDATHPYASAVTENIVSACAATGTEYLRLSRSGAAAPEDAEFAEDIAAAVEYLNSTEGNILLTTGSKELQKYTSIREFSDRVYARVLPMEESLRLCQKAGLKPAHILAMQGPFSREMNTAMLKSTGAKYLVTKDSGRNGGFEEKIAAAREAGVRLVVIGRPPQQAGISFEDTVSLLCDRFQLQWKPKITILGIGPGSRDTMTEAARKAIADAGCIIGAQRMIEAVAHPGQILCNAIAPEKILEAIRENSRCRRILVAMSGDVGFFSGTKMLLPRLNGYDVTILPGISSMVYLCARLGVSYEDAVFVSAHGREKSILPQIRANRKIFTLVGGENGMGKLCRELTEAGLGQVKVSVGERLSYPDEKITVGLAWELAEKSFQSLSAAWIENDCPSKIVTHGLPEEAFARTEAVPMTKSEVRSVCLSKLRLERNSICWDVGAGSGSVAIEMALQAPEGQVYAIERKEAAVALLEENRKSLGAENVTIVAGLAPEACEALPAPTHAFIGGSSGNMREIMALLLSKNPEVRIVATAIALESVAELTQCMKRFRFRDTEVVCMSVAKNKKVGPYNLMTGQNPIYIFTMQGGNA